MNDENWKLTNNVKMMNWNGSGHEKIFTSTNGFSGFTKSESYPQASHDILQNSHASILFAAFSPFERKLVSNDVAFKALLIINATMRKINYKISKLPIKRQEVIFNGTPYEEYKAELRYLTEQEPQPAGFKRKIIVVKNRAELETAIKNKDIALIPTVEGLVSFYGTYNWYYYKHWDCMENYGKCYEELITNIREVKNSAYKPFLVAPAHLAWNRVVGHAKAFDSEPKKREQLAEKAKVIKFRKVIFNKSGHGIIDTIYTYYNSARKDNPCLCNNPVKPGTHTMGTQIMRELLDNKTGKPILIDMRHMDIQARLEYIRLVKKYAKEEGRKIPIVISHTAVNGKDSAQSKYFGDCPVLDNYNELIKPTQFYKQHAGCLKKLGINPINLNIVGWFHPWSINVCNEEIAAVYATDGIMGITMEERVLGTNRINYSESHYKKLNDFLDQKKYTGSRDSFRIAEPLMRNILYIVEQSGFAGQLKSWEHIAIGSDFDGVINPIDVCPTAGDIPALYHVLAMDLPLLAEFMGKTSLLCGKEKEVEVLLNKLFYQNGERFILTYYNY